jgi:hypothetical protein
MSKSKNKNRRQHQDERIPDLESQILDESLP